MIYDKLEITLGKEDIDYNMSEEAWQDFLSKQRVEFVSKCTTLVNELYADYVANRELK